MVEKNPFNPSFGKIPHVFVGRQELAGSIAEGLMNTDGPNQTTIISGIRGVGKTALLTEVCRKIEQDSSCLVVDIPVNADILETLVQAVQAKSGAAGKAISGIDSVSVSAMGVGVGYTAKNTQTTYQLALEALLGKMQKKKKHLLVAIDEASATTAVKQFASVYQILIRKNYPVSLVMTGLPRNISELQNNKVLTFLLRAARVDLPMLDHVSVQYGFKNSFAKGKKSVSADVLKKMTALTNGYSYAFQLLGYLVWETGDCAVTEQTLENVMDKYKEMLFRNAYVKIYEELSDMDRLFVKGMAADGNGEIAVGSIAAYMDRSSEYVAAYKRRLKDAGVIEAFSYGHVRFALPLFGEYVREFWF